MGVLKKEAVEGQERRGRGVSERVSRCVCVCVSEGMRVQSVSE